MFLFLASCNGKNHNDQVVQSNQNSFDMSLQHNYEANIIDSNGVLRTIRMTLYVSSDTVYYTVLTMPLDSNSKSTIYDHEGNLMDSTGYSIPNDGFNYWFVPFDVAQSPFIIIGSGSVDCTCIDANEGTCCESDFTGKHWYCRTCTPSKCDGTCEISLPSVSVHGAGVLVKGDAVVYD